MWKAILFATAALTGVAAGPSSILAADPTADSSASGVAADLFDGHEQTLPPILQIIKNGGMKITALLPQVGNLPGYLLEAPGGKMQVIYITPDGKSMVVGVQQAIAPDGKGLQNVTAIQIAGMKNRFDAVQRRIDDQKRMAEEAQQRADDASAALVDQQHQMAQAAQQFGAPAQVGIPGPSQAATPDAPALAPVPSAGPVQNVDRAEFLSALNKARFSSLAESVAYFRLGKATNPTIYMVVDPQCPHCHAAWSYLRPLVMNGALTVKVIVISGLPGSDPLAISLLANPDVGRDWINGQGSTDMTPVAAPPADGTDASRKARQNLDKNMDFVRQVDVKGTPWMAYVKDGKVYQYSGDARVAAFVSGLLTP